MNIHVRIDRLVLTDASMTPPADSLGRELQAHLATMVYASAGASSAHNSLSGLGVRPAASDRGGLVGSLAASIVERLHGHEGLNLGGRTNL
jgi:hypothetical protein